MSTGSDLRADVLALFADGYGRAMTLRRTTSGAYDPATGATAAGSTADFTGKAKLGTYRDGVIDGTRILATDRKATFLPDDAALIPRAGDLLIDGAATYSVVDVRERELGTDWITFTMQVRNAG